jgi:F0F1-type ATP synthase assembly protein I
LSKLPNKPLSSQKAHKPFSDYVKYVHISFQMMAIMGIGVWLGIKLDTYFQVNFPIFLCILALASTIYAIYFIIKKVT